MSPQEFINLRHQLETMTYDPQDPVDVVFTEIDDLAEIAEAIGDPLSDVQQTKLGYVILQNTKRFSSGLKNEMKRHSKKRLGTISSITSEVFRKTCEGLECY